MSPTILEALLKIALLIGALMTAAACLALVEQRMGAWIQDRWGPNGVGISLLKIRLFGPGQPIADGLKFMFKEESTPGHVDKFLYLLAPIAIFTAAIAVFAVIPFGSVLPADPGEEPIRLVVAPGIDVGMIYVFAVGSISVYGVVLGGWASNNKDSFSGSLRAGAQLISYELPLGLGILGVALASGSLRLDVIITEQARTGTWNVLVQPLGFLVFTAAALAVACRLPFDPPEAEKELAAGYHPEYFGIKLMMYLVADFLHMITASFLIVILFFGGWHLWGLTGSSDLVTWPLAVLRVVVLLAKVVVLILFFMLVRWSWPRLRFDRSMALAWNVMLPCGLVNVVAVAAWIQYGEPLARLVGLSDASGTTSMELLGWVVLIASCAAVMLAAHAASKNRAEHDPICPDGQVEEGAPR